MSESNRGGAIAVGAVLLAAAVGAFFWLRESREPPAAPPARAPEPPPAVVEAPAQPAHPIEDAVVDTPAVVDATPLPALHESDADALAALMRLLGSESVPSWLVPEFVIQRAVATIDNLARTKIASNVSVVRAVPGTLGVEGEAEVRVLSPANQARYAPYVDAFERADSAALVENYVRLYPLFQQAYRELGSGDAYFNDRLVEVIDHMLAAPEVAPPIELVRPKVFWEFRDPKLEAMSAGHKLMVRVGPEQARRIKVKLRELRDAVAGAPVHDAPAPAPVEPDSPG
jgi:hypothetical protein